MLRHLPREKVHCATRRRANRKTLKRIGGLGSSSSITERLWREFPTWNGLPGLIPEIQNFIACWATPRRGLAIHSKGFDGTSERRDSTPANRTWSIGARNF